MMGLFSGQPYVNGKAAVVAAGPPGQHAVTVRPRIAVAYVAAGFGVLLGTVALVFKVDLGTHSLTDIVVVATGGFLFLGAGVAAHARRPDTRVGLLMVLVGCGLFAEDLQLSKTAWVHTAGILLVGASSGFAAHLVLAFPSGRLSSWVDRLLVGTAYATVFVLIPFGQLFNDTSKRIPRRNLLLITTDMPVTSVVNQVVATIGVVVAMGMVTVLVRRWTRASPPMRRVLAPVFLAGLMGGGATFVGLALGSDHSLYAEIIWVYRVAFCLLPLGFLAGVLHVQVGQTPVETLLTRLREPLSAAELQAALARALGDPSLEVGYWRPDIETFVDGDGRPLTLPKASSECCVRLVERDGRRVAALVHDPALLDNVSLLNAVTTAAGLALEIQRLIAEVRAPRNRIVAAANTGTRRHGLDALSKREREVLALMAEGRTNGAIADRLRLTLKTIESHVHSIFAKLGLLPEPNNNRRVLAVRTYLQADD
jgi:DNA-binding CsgD family transcriptional regulator